MDGVFLIEIMSNKQPPYLNKDILFPMTIMGLVGRLGTVLPEIVIEATGKHSMTTPREYSLKDIICADT